uniref:Uncharacterized protein n=1 Tax=Rhizophora mucronata TaxID=61149 RepID=A0A2P2P3Q0_RHIMU
MSSILFCLQFLLSLFDSF